MIDNLLEQISPRNPVSKLFAGVVDWAVPRAARLPATLKLIAQGDGDLFANFFPFFAGG